MKEITQIKELLNKGEIADANKILQKLFLTPKDVWNALYNSSYPEYIKHITSMSFSDNVNRVIINLTSGKCIFGIDFFIKSIQSFDDINYLLCFQRSTLILKLSHIYRQPNVSVSMLNCFEDMLSHYLCLRTIQKRYKESSSNFWECLAYNEWNKASDFYKGNREVDELISRITSSLSCRNFSAAADHFTNLVDIVMDLKKKEKQNKEKEQQKEKQKEQKRNNPFSDREKVHTEEDEQNEEIDSEENDQENQDQTEESASNESRDQESDQSNSSESDSEENASDDQDSSSSSNEDADFDDFDDKDQEREYEEDDEDEEYEEDEEDYESFVEDENESAIPPLNQQENDWGYSDEHRVVYLNTAFDKILFDSGNTNNDLNLATLELLSNNIRAGRSTENEVTGKVFYTPSEISKRDLLYLSSGFAPISWDVQLPPSPSIPAFIYLDVSGSTQSYWPIIMTFGRWTNTFTRVVCFSTKLQEPAMNNEFYVDITSTGGTDFDIVANHMIENNVKEAYVVTDDQGRIKDELKAKLFDIDITLLTIAGYSVNSYHSNPWTSLAKRVINLE